MSEISDTVLTKEQIEIQEVREKISDVISSNKKFDDDLYLLQWLKVQKFNPGKAEDMIRKSLKWRQEQNIHSEVAQEFPPEFLKEFPIPFTSTKDGNPVVYIHAGKMDFKKGITDCGRTRWIQFWGMLFAQMEDKMIAFNKARNTNTVQLTSEHTTGIIVLIDILDFSTLQLLNLDVLRCSVEIVGNLAKYFPAVAGTAVFYNMNPVFKTLFSAIKPLLSGPCLTLEVFGSDEKLWRKRVLEIIDLEALNDLENHWNRVEMKQGL
ncbi:unnamed protein product [Allacma fusca]|uniref:CRAL-TRIO domain-containing protein n=1 Tax=Allacma fusca TaxID=39272 RepID=A0A8J2Q1N7_9HEXA|nr:unnamed protein product [Allacma fusca]